MDEVEARLRRAAAAEDRVFELRVYKTEPGRLDALNARFRDHTNRLFEKHGMDIVGYWEPTDQENTLIYILAFPSQEARDASWRAFGSDPEWQKVAKESQVDGRILAERPESTMMTPTDYSPIR